MGEKTTKRSPAATFDYAPLIKVQPTHYQVPKMQMAASPIQIEKGPLKLGEMPRILGRLMVQIMFMPFVSVVESTKIAYLKTPLLSLWGFIGDQILGFFTTISKLFKAIFRLNKVPEKVTEAKPLNVKNQSPVHKASGQTISANLPSAAVVAASSLPVAKSNRLTLEIINNYESMLIPGTNGIESTESYLAKQFNGPWEGQINMVASSPPWAGVVAKVSSQNTKLSKESENRVLNQQDIKPLREPLYQPWLVLGEKTTKRSPAAAIYSRPLFSYPLFRTILPNIPRLVLPVGINTTISIANLSKWLMNLWDYFGRLLMETFGGIHYMFRPALL